MILREAYSGFISRKGLHFFFFLVGGGAKQAVLKINSHSQNQ